MASFEFSTVLKHISVSLHINIGLLWIEILEIFKAIYRLFPEISEVLRQVLAW